MHLERAADGTMTIKLTEREAKILCSDLCDVSPYRSEDRTFLQGLIDALRGGKGPGWHWGKR